jgi:hypothetical protein
MWSLTKKKGTNTPNIAYMERHEKSGGLTSTWVTGWTVNTAQQRKIQQNFYRGTEPLGLKP